MFLTKRESRTSDFTVSPGWHISPTTEEFKTKYNFCNCAPFQNKYLLLSTSLKETLGEIIDL